MMMMIHIHPPKLTSYSKIQI